MRTAPQQGRSRETVERVLAAAEAEIAEVGVAAAGTRSIAARAGVSVGSLYRFFRSIDDLVDALAVRYLDDVLRTYTRLLDDVRPGTDVGDVAAGLVRQAAALQLTHPGYYRLTEDLPPERPDSPAHQVRERLVDLFATALERAGVDTPPAERRRVVELCVETVRHTLVRAPLDPAERRPVVAELETLVAAYLRARFAASSR
ncbi:TetR/AcrR family transcriptional regulator [Nocardioides marinquilinus]|uniref:TetR/AcrR family transcriptional regulator n=1 Tax=Nocardioides marinquilinus TaxID=1210400 RepID=A0ABP9PEX9_9ACTN